MEPNATGLVLAVVGKPMVVSAASEVRVQVMNQITLGAFLPCEPEAIGLIRPVMGQ